MKKVKLIRKYILPLIIALLLLGIIIFNRSEADELNTTFVAKANLTVKDLVSCDTGDRISETLEVFVGSKVARSNLNASKNLIMKNLPAGTKDGTPVMNQFSFFGLDSKKYYQLMDDDCVKVNLIDMTEGDNHLDRMKVKQITNESFARTIPVTTTPNPTLNVPQNAKAGSQIILTINSKERLDNSIIKWKDICDNSQLPSDGWKTLWAVKSNSDVSKYTTNFTVPNLSANCKIYFIADVGNEYAEVLVPENGLEDTNIPYLTISQ